MINKKVKLNQIEEIGNESLDRKLEEIHNEFYKSIYNDLEFSPKNISLYKQNKTFKMYNLLSNLFFYL